MHHQLQLAYPWNLPSYVDMLVTILAKFHYWNGNPITSNRDIARIGRAPWHYHFLDWVALQSCMVLVLGGMYCTLDAPRGWDLLI
jgi:hypothetical protein